MALTAIIFAAVLVVALAALYWLWWSLPKQLAVRDASKRSPAEKRESYYRLQVSKALGGILALGAFVVTVEQTISAQLAAVAARVRANQLTEYEHYQKALEALTRTGRSEVLHAGAIFSLGSMARENPELAKTVATELALAAMTYPAGSPVPAAGGSLGPPPEADSASNTNAISREAQVALSVLGSLSVMGAGLPLQLAGGRFHGADLPHAILNGAQFPGADLSASDLYAAQLFNANFRGATLNGANLTEALLSSAGFYGAVLCEGVNSLVPVLNRGMPVGVQMSGATMDLADFQNAWLIGALLATNPDDSLKKVTNLTDANFRDASLKGADLSYSMLNFADFSGADLTDANFKGAAMFKVKMQGARFCRTIMSDGSTKSDGCPAWDVPPDPAPRQTSKAVDKDRECVKGKTWREVEFLRVNDRQGKNP